MHCIHHSMVCRYTVHCDESLHLLIHHKDPHELRAKALPPVSVPFSQASNYRDRALLHKIAKAVSGSSFIRVITNGAKLLY